MLPLGGTTVEPINLNIMETYINYAIDVTNPTAVYNYLIDTSVISEESLDLICGINGMSIKTLNDVIEYCTSYKNIEALLNSDGLYSVEPVEKEFSFEYDGHLIEFSWDDRISAFYVYVDDAYADFIELDEMDKLIDNKEKLAEILLND